MGRGDAYFGLDHPIRNRVGGEYRDTGDLVDNFVHDCRRGSGMGLVVAVRAVTSGTTSQFAPKKRFNQVMNRSMMLPSECVDLRKRGLLPFFRSSMHSTQVQ